MAKTFISELARRTGRDRKSVEALLQALGQAIRQHCGDLDTVAVPAFGNFIAVKHDEQIVTDRTNGCRLLLPPEVVLTFRPAGKLRKLADNHSDE